MTNAISIVVSEYRKQRELSLRAFADEISNGLPQDGVTYQSVSNWENGVHSPSFQLLVLMAMRFTDWRHDFAADCLAVINPEYYEPATIIGRRALEDAS